MNPIEKSNEVTISRTQKRQRVEEMERSIEYFVAKKIDTFRDRLEKENMNL